MSMMEIGKKDTGATQYIDQRSEGIITSQQLTAFTSASDELLLATHGRTFHFAARFLSPQHRHLVIRLYAFFRTLDDLVDKPAEGSRIEDIRKELDAWKGWFAGGLPFPAPQEPLGSRVASVLGEHPVPIAVFLDFLDGLASDVEPQEVCDFSELYRYCYRVAGTVGLAMAQILGVSSTQALVAAQNLGIGMQLTNILRDVGGDLASGRIYLPREDLARFGSSRAHLFRLYSDQRGPDDRFRALMRYQVARAHHYYIRGMSGIWLLPRNCRLPILVAGRLYRRILTVIEHKNYDVLRSRATTRFPEKLREAGIAFTLDRLWRRGEEWPSTEAEMLLED
ncbi:MAG TPA: phytoene/squalene synthase family protein [Ktedonobacteraceae bacterium]|nr:phytoene/squalene synthase family protein [Ktedonobacteraceae bacterium]